MKWSEACLSMWVFDFCYCWNFERNDAQGLLEAWQAILMGILTQVDATDLKM